MYQDPNLTYMVSVFDREHEELMAERRRNIEEHATRVVRRPSWFARLRSRLARTAGSRQTKPAASRAAGPLAPCCARVPGLAEG